MDLLEVPNSKHYLKKMERNDQRAGAQADTPAKETLEISTLSIEVNQFTF